MSLWATGICSPTYSQAHGWCTMPKETLYNEKEPQHVPWGKSHRPVVFTPTYVSREVGSLTKPFTPINADIFMSAERLSRSALGVMAAEGIPLGVPYTAISVISVGSVASNHVSPSQATMVMGLTLYHRKNAILGSSSVRFCQFQRIDSLLGYGMKYSITHSFLHPWWERKCFFLSISLFCQKYTICL